MKAGTPDGKLYHHAWPGGYAILYHDVAGDVFCPDCAATAGVVTSFIHWEGPPLYCDECGKTLESEYGDPEENQ